jgi:hypothetical protein
MEGIRNHNNDASAVGYQMPNLREHILNEDILRRLEVNDPGVEYLSYTDDCYYDDSAGWIEGTGSAIGHSNVLRMLKFWFYEHEKICLDEFCLGLQHNRSIECLCLRVEVDSILPSDPDIFQIIAPFFEHNRNLRCIDIEVTSRFQNKSSGFGSLMSALSKCRNDQLHSVKMSCDNFKDQEKALLIDLLTKQKILLEIGFDHEIGSLGRTALANILNHPESNIHALCLRYHQLEDEGATILGAALATNNTLKTLTLDDEHLPIGLVGW